jgi:hypothetical protein
MINHVESHLSKELRLIIACCYLVYKAARLVLKTIDKFKYYMKFVHSIIL